MEKIVANVTLRMCDFKFQSETIAICSYGKLYSTVYKTRLLCSGGVVPDKAVACCAALSSLKLTLATGLGFRASVLGKLNLCYLHSTDVFVRMATGAG